MGPLWSEITLSINKNLIAMSKSNRLRETVQLPSRLLTDDNVVRSTYISDI
jgi:hypothetical protein